MLKVETPWISHTKVILLVTQPVKTIILFGRGVGVILKLRLIVDECI